MDNAGDTTSTDRYPALTSDKPYQDSCCLSDYIRERKPGLKDALKLAENIASSFIKLHQAGAFHGCFSPGNIIVSLNGDTIDPAGLDTVHPEQAFRDTGADLLTLDSGTLAYIAPELTGRLDFPADSKSDLYSLGIILFQLIYGRVPFDFKDPSRVIHAHLARDPFAGVDPGPISLPWL